MIDQKLLDELIAAKAELAAQHEAYDLARSMLNKATTGSDAARERYRKALEDIGEAA